MPPDSKITPAPKQNHLKKVKISAAMNQENKSRKTVPTVKPNFFKLLNDKSSLSISCFTSLIQLILFLPVYIIFKWRLILFKQKKITKNKRIHFCAHKTSVCVCRRFNNRFTAHIE